MVRDAHGAEQMQSALQAWVSPIGPSTQILLEGQSANPITVDSSAPHVAWQHQRPGFGAGSVGTYESKRTGRIGSARTGAAWHSAAQTIDAKVFRGNRIRLRAQVRAGTGASAAAWLRVDTDGSSGFFDNMANRMITGSTWTPVEIVGIVANDANSIVFGPLVIDGNAWFNEFSLEAKESEGAWRRVPIENPQMNDGLKGWRPGVASEGYTGENLLTIDSTAHQDGPALLVSLATVALTEDLFERRPRPGEVIEVSLGGGLRALVPISLLSSADQTVPMGDLDRANEQLQAISPLGSDHINTRLADVVVAWNVIKHFYPYQEVVPDWNNVLADVLAAELDAKMPTEHEMVLKRLFAAFGDGHSHLSSKSDYRPPVAFGYIENEVVVLASEMPQIKPGDVLMSIDGMASSDLFARKIQLISGSRQWKTQRAANAIANGVSGSKATLVLERNDMQHRVQVVRESGSTPRRHSHPAISEIEPNIWLVDLDRASMPKISAQIESIAEATGVIFDLRGYPNRNHGVLNHLISAPENDQWMHIAQITHPNLPGAATPRLGLNGMELAAAGASHQG